MKRQEQVQQQQQQQACMANIKMEPFNPQLNPEHFHPQAQQQQLPQAPPRGQYNVNVQVQPPQPVPPPRSTPGVTVSG